MQELFSVFKDFMTQLAQVEYFVWVLASMFVCGICGLVTYVFRSDS